MRDATILLAAISLIACGNPDSRDRLLDAPPDDGVISGSAELAGPPIACTVDATGKTDVSAELQSCINEAPVGAVVTLAAGTYRVDTAVRIERTDLTLTTAGLLGVETTCFVGTSPCARFVPGPALGGQPLFAIGSVTPAHRVTLDHLIFDGRGTSRRANPDEARAYCQAGGGRNLVEHGSDGSKLVHSASIDALCGTAVGWAVSRTGRNNTIRANYFGGNGTDYTETAGLWCDGLTIGAVHDTFVVGNVFVDNTDVALILGGATGVSAVADNVVEQKTRHVFAGIMLTNWSNPALPQTAQWGDFRGLDLARNRVRCGALCDIGMQLGVYPWIHDAKHSGNFRAMGGFVHDNVIESKGQGMVVAGGGTPVYPMVLQDNVFDVTPSASTKTYARPGTRKTGRLNVHALGSENFVDFPKGQAGDIDGTDPWHALY